VLGLSLFGTGYTYLAARCRSNVFVPPLAFTVKLIVVEVFFCTTENEYEPSDRRTNAVSSSFSLKTARELLILSTLVVGGRSSSRIESPMEYLDLSVSVLQVRA